MTKNVGDCPKCNEGKLRIKEGRYGPFVSCEQYPKCKFSRKLKPNDVERVDVASEACESNDLQCWECPYEGGEDGCFLMEMV